MMGSKDHLDLAVVRAGGQDLGVAGAEVDAPHPLVVSLVLGDGVRSLGVPKGDHPLVVAAHQLAAVEAVVGQTAQL